MSTDSIPDALRRILEDDLQPVRPLPPPWQRTLGVAAVATIVMTIALATANELRSDLGDLPMWLSWGCSLLELGIGVFIVGLALREAVPGGGVPRGAAQTALATGVLLQVLVGVATFTHSAGMPLGGDWLAKSFGCLKHDSAMVLPTFAVTLWLIFRALPMRAPMAGLLGGAGAAITGDAITHLLCPMSDLRHVLVWHTGAIIGFAAFGWIVGFVWTRLRWR